MAIAALMISAGVMAQSANKQQKPQGKTQTQTTQVQQNTKTATAKTDVKKQEIKKEQGKTGKSRIRQFHL